MHSMKKMQKILLYLPLFLLILIYFGHGFEGFTGSEEFTKIVAVLGLSSSLTAWLVFLIGPLDTGVALLLTFGKRIFPALSWKYLYLWAGLWPWVPRVFELYGGLEVEYFDGIALSILALLAYYLHKKYNLRK